MRTLIAASISFVFVSELLAHPGHGAGGGSHEWSHYLTNPGHLLTWLLVVLIFATATKWFSRPARAFVHAMRRRS